MRFDGRRQRPIEGLHWAFRFAQEETGNVGIACTCRAVVVVRYIGREHKFCDGRQPNRDTAIGSYRVHLRLATSYVLLQVGGKKLIWMFGPLLRSANMLYIDRHVLLGVGR